MLSLLHKVFGSESALSDKQAANRDATAVLDTFWSPNH